MIAYSATQSMPEELITHTPERGDRILVVDDSLDNLFLTESILLEDGYDVVCAENGTMALDAIHANPPSLVLLDVMMPDMDGYEVTRRMRQNKDLPYIPILLVTAHDRPCVVDGLDAGADDFIRKPITEVDELLARVRSLLRLKHTIDERDHIARQREDFVSRLTHDLRTPLIAADRMLNMINEGIFGEVPPAIGESISTVVRNNENLLAMVNTLLEVYRYDAGSKSLTVSRFDFCKLVKEVVTELSPLADQKQLALYLCSPGDGSDGDDSSPSGAKGRNSYRILGDRIELRRVITNIIGNAIKFTDDGSVRVTIRFTQDEANSDASESHGNGSGNGNSSGNSNGDDDPSDNWVILEVVDTGSGMSPDDQAHLFERFRQGKNNRAGSGLGLHLSHRIVEAHDGQIDVESQPDVGSTFTIRLPVNL